MRRSLAPAFVAALVLAGCGSSSGSSGAIVFGIKGGSGTIQPFNVTIRPNGSVQRRGTITRLQKRQIPPAAVKRLERQIGRANLVSRSCAGSPPALVAASQYIRTGGRTVTVRGGAATCEPAFARVWDKLVAAVGGSTAKPNAQPIEFGMRGGNIVPFSVVIRPDGSVRATGSMKAGNHRIDPATVRRLRTEIADAHLVGRRCTGVVPDIGSRFIRVGNRTVTVHGSCNRRFERSWTALMSAVIFRLG